MVESTAATRTATMLVRELKRAGREAGWVGFTLTLRDEGHSGQPRSHPLPGVHLRKGPVGGQSHSDNGQPRATSAPVQRWRGDARGFSETEWGGGRAAIR
jgi:hypothetical protein